MLQRWKKKFPISFDNAPYIFERLDTRDQERLSQILTRIEPSGLLKEAVVQDLLSFAEPVSLSVLEGGLNAGVDFTWLMRFLTEKIDRNGLTAAVELFSLARLDFRQEHLEHLPVVTDVLANPLSQTIFSARLRVFSPYAPVYELITVPAARAIIEALNLYEDEESRLRYFFDYCATLRPLPCSQLDVDEVDINEIALSTLNQYCHSMIKAIATPEDYRRVQSGISELRTKGASKALFEAIKYSVGSLIEEKDMGSMRRYDDLMRQIWISVNQPQPELFDFTSELQASKGYQRIASEAMGSYSLHAAGSRVPSAEVPQEPFPEHEGIIRL